MPFPLPANIATLFAPGQSSGRPVLLEWCLIKRHGRPLLLLPRSFRAARNGLGLYAAQRPAVKLVRWLLPFLIGSPLRRGLPCIEFETNTASPLWEFLGSQAGVAPAQLVAPAVLCGNQPEADQRFVILGLDVGGSPAVVVKAGLSPAARRIVAGEADTLARLPAGMMGRVELKGRLSSARLSAFATPYCSGQPPRTDRGIEKVLCSWLRSASPVEFADLPVGQRLAAACHAEPLYVSIRAQLDNHPFRPVICHGDFAPWNIRVSPTGDWTVVDWERSDLNGVPGWDWFHFEIQTSILRKRLTEEQAAPRVEALIASGRFQEYAAAAGIEEITKPLLLAYLLHQNRVVLPGEGLHVSLKLQELLAARWRAQR